MSATTDCLDPVLAPNGFLVRCRKCENCMKVKRNDWAYRMDRELKYGTHAYQTFVTLTYKDCDLCIIPKSLRFGNYKRETAYAIINPNHWTKFIETLQRITKPFSGGALNRYYALLEYGAVEKRPHIHIVLFSPVSEELTKQLVTTAWDKISKGSIIDFQPITFADIVYCAKHNLKECGGNEFQNTWQPSITRCSRKNGGIGINFILENIHNFDDKFVFLNNFKMSMPEFYRKKQKALNYIKEFQPFVQDIVFKNIPLLKRLLSSSILQRLSTKEREGIKKKKEIQMLSQIHEVQRLYAVPLSQQFWLSDFNKFVVSRRRQRNKDLRTQRLNRFHIKNLLKVKTLKFKNNGKSNSTNGRN